ncbi:histidine phosphatase family protein [Phenylobacterium aquaticum]|uniref:histidine phosphatase family protein n=1 Tax=Phenylobacterium aquaticum TaxID=1763816 RepID=UPI001F5CB231|nr:histidine phosphatase family protein [Phenylobacterium aquaticum]MCI3131794.1 histidine phosphatase family protein [Phenylobacterium aquaticum]
MIYLVRHGQTVFNAEGRLQGHVDSPLTELGRDQARQAGAALARLTEGGAGWRIISSPLGRAQDTAEAIRQALGAPAIETDDRLIELSWGEWDGRLRADLKAQHPEAFGETGWAFTAPIGESFEAARARLGGWLGALPPEPERRIIAVSHGVSGRILRGVYANLPRAETLAQAVPQDATFRLSGGAIERLDF